MKSEDGLGDLISALQILHKYGKPNYPTCCFHDTMLVLIDPSLVSDEDKKELYDLGFFPDDDTGECFKSYRFVSN